MRWVLILVLANLWQCVSSATYDVTSSSCTGPGSFVAALEAANSNPGPDIIQFNGVSQVVAVNCPRAYPPPDIVTVSAAYGYVNESVEIIGNGVTMLGRQVFVTSGGLITPLDSACPTRPHSTDIIVYATLGFLYIEGPNVNVTVRNMTIVEHEYILKTRRCDNCTITLENVRANRIIPIVSCLQPAIEIVGDGAALNILNNVWTTIWNYNSVIAVSDVYVYVGGISGDVHGGPLYIVDSFFDLFGSASGFADWEGKVDIVTSTLLRTGGLMVNSALDSSIVNTAWINTGNGVGNLEPEDRIYNRGPGTLHFISSTLFYSTLACGSICRDSGSPGAIAPWAGAGNITFQWTAVGINFDDPSEAPLLDNRFGNLFSADNLTWMQPGVNQTATVLKTVTNQPGLLTDPPGLGTYTIASWQTLITPLLGNVSTPGRLIDQIQNANSTNRLINPVTGLEILKDVFGNPRNDGDRRDIGAVQVGASVRLTNAPDNTCANLSWNQPSAPQGNSVTGYLVQYAPSSSGSQMQLNITGEMTTFTRICNLSEGVKYEFKVEPYYTDGGVGPPSNLVYMTAYGPFLPPTIFPSKTPTANEIFVNWTSPSLGGRSLLGYAYIYYPKDFSSPAQVVASTANGATLYGLSPGKVYVICIAAEATNANLEGGSETAIGNCIDVSTGPSCFTLIKTVKAKRRVRSGSKFALYVSLRRPKGVKAINGIGVDLMLPTGVAIMDSFFIKRASKYGIVNVTSSGLTVKGIVLESRKRILKFPLQVRTCNASTIRLAAMSFLQLEEPYGFQYCAQDFSWEMSCRL